MTKAKKLAEEVAATVPRKQPPKPKKKPDAPKPKEQTAAPVTGATQPGSDGVGQSTGGGGPTPEPARKPEPVTTGDRDGGWFPNFFDS